MLIHSTTVAVTLSKNKQCLIHCLVQKTWAMHIKFAATVSVADVHVVPENIHTHPKEGHWNIPRGRGGGVSKAKKKSMKLNWKFQGYEGGWIFSETTQLV